MKLKNFLISYLEAFIWTAGLAFLFISVGMHWPAVTVCPLSLAGIDYCPGCGLGRSVGLLLNGQVEASLQAHPLGIPALIILLFRIFSIIKSKKNGTGTKIFTRTQR